MMTQMELERGGVFGGVDTHADFHVAVVIDGLGRHLGCESFATDSAGIGRLLGWVAGFGPLVRVGVEGTGSYGAGLARALACAGIEVVEVDRPDRRERRRAGKSDPIDAAAAARAAASGRASGLPKSRDGSVEMIRQLRVVREAAVKAKTAAWNQLRALVTTAPGPLRDELDGLARAALLARCAGLRPARTPGGQLADPTAACKRSLAMLARRIRQLQDEVDQLDADLEPLVAAAAPRLTAMLGVGTETAARLLVTAGDNPHRVRSDAAFAHLCGAAPIPVSSGRTDRHRLNRGGDRSANQALYRIVMTRLVHDKRTRDYATRRTAQGKTKREIIRCLKRYVAREVHRAITADFADAARPQSAARAA